MEEFDDLKDLDMVDAEARKFIIKCMKRDAVKNIPSNEAIDFVLNMTFNFFSDMGVLDEEDDNADPVEYSADDQVEYIKNKMIEEPNAPKLTDDEISMIVDYNYEFDLWFEDNL